LGANGKVAYGIAKLIALAYTVDMITSTQAAKEIGCSVATISRWAAKLGYTRRFGNCILLTKPQVNAIKKAWKKKAGNPDFGKSLRTTIAK
jgi:transposase